MVYHICCSTDDNYAQHCAVMLCSLFEKNAEAQFEIHLLIVELSEENTAKINNLVESYSSKLTIHQLNSQLLEKCLLRTDRTIPISAFSRLLIGSILDENIDYTLYLDVDIIIADNITPLFKLNIEEFPVAAIKDRAIPKEDFRMRHSFPHNWDYFNSGVMLINLKYWRHFDVESDFFSIIKEEEFLEQNDQDVLNIAFKGKWFSLSLVWNRFSTVAYDDSFFLNHDERAYFEKNPKIIHFAGGYGLKPWNKVYFVEYRSLYYHYLKKTEWRNFRPLKVKKGLLRAYKQLFSAYLHQFLYRNSLYSLFRIITIPIRMFRRSS